MLPDNFDPLYAALGIKRKEWTKTVPVTSIARTDIDTTTRAREAKWNRSKRVGVASA